MLRQDGTLSFTIRSTNESRKIERGPKIGKTKETGADLFARMMIHHGNKVQRIEAHWVSYNEFLRANYVSFRAASQKLRDPNKAVWQTFTGKMASLFGFNKARIVQDNSSEVIVLFER